MANQIAIDVYEFGMGMDFTGRKETKVFIRENIADLQPTSIYNYKNEHFSDVRSKIVENGSGPLKEFYVAQTVAQVKTLLDA